jgi:hypothetical protein
MGISGGCRLQHRSVSGVNGWFHIGHRGVGGHEDVGVLGGADQSFIDVSTELELSFASELGVVCPLFVGFFGLGEGVDWEGALGVRLVVADISAVAKVLLDAVLPNAFFLFLLLDGHLGSGSRIIPQLVAEILVVSGCRSIIRQSV